MAEPTLASLLTRIEILERHVAQLERTADRQLWPVEVSEEEFDRLTKDHPDMIGVPVIQCGDRVWPKRKPSPSRSHRHNSASGILPADGGLRNSEAARERGIAELPVSWARRLPRLVLGRRTPELWHSLLGFLVGRSRPSQRSEPSR